jgi:hypothetical protein
MDAMRSMRDSDLRHAVKHRLLSSFHSDPNTLIVDELGLRHGAGRVDIAVINGELHGYELKSDHDTLRRLPGQVAVYNSVLDRVTLVVAACHWPQASSLIPEWWEVVLAESHTPHPITFCTVRTGNTNPTVSALAIAKLLWRDEALRFLEVIGAADGLKSKPRRIIYNRLVEVVDLANLRGRVRDQLRSRQDWRPVEPQT